MLCSSWMEITTGTAISLFFPVCKLDVYTNLHNSGYIARCCKSDGPYIQCNYKFTKQILAICIIGIAFLDNSLAKYTIHDLSFLLTFFSKHLPFHTHHNIMFHYICNSLILCNTIAILLLVTDQYYWLVAITLITKHNVNAWRCIILSCPLHVMLYVAAYLLAEIFSACTLMTT